MVDGCVVQQFVAFSSGGAEVFISPRRPSPSEIVNQAVEGVEKIPEEEHFDDTLFLRDRPVDVAFIEFGNQWGSLRPSQPSLSL